MVSARVFTFFVILKCLIFSKCLEIIPEGVKVMFANPKYMVNASLHIRRYGRASPYFVNSEGTTLVAYDDNVTGCKGIINDQFMGDIFKSRGIRCPLLPNHYVLKNMTFLAIPAVQNLPYKWPFEKGKIVGTVRTYPEKELICEGYGIVTFKETRPSLKKKNKRIPAPTGLNQLKLGHTSFNSDLQIDV